MSKGSTIKSSASESTEALIDFAIITAIEIERMAVCRAFGLGDKDRVRKGARVYWRGRLPLENGEFYELVATQSPDMANVDAALLTQDTIHDWEPGALLMVGIAGAASNEVALGDLVIGSDVYYYERGKVTSKGKMSEPKMYRADATLWSNVIALPKWTARIPVQRPDKKKDRPKIHYGVIASGEKVIAEKAARNQIAEVHRKILAIEMEGYGFSTAVWQNFDQRRHLVIRAICDRADRSKSEDWQPYAAAVAAGFAKHFLFDRPLEPSRNLFKPERKTYITSVEFTLEQPLGSFSEEEFKAALQDLIGADIEKIRIASIQPGSIKVLVEGDSEELVRIVEAFQRSIDLQRNFVKRTGLKSILYLQGGRQYPLQVQQLNQTPEWGEEKTRIDSAAAEKFTWDVFISYSHEDKAMAERIQRTLEERGIRVWRDIDQIHPGDLFIKAIEQGLENSASVAILISPDAMNSGWVEEEYSRAISLAKSRTKPVRVIPVLLRDASLPGFLANRTWVNFRDDSKFDQNIERLVWGIRSDEAQGRPLAASQTMEPFLFQIRFLCFFPEGLLRPVYRFLISKMNVKDAVARAEQKGIVRAMEVSGIEMIGADPERIHELRSHIKDKSKAAGELLALLGECFTEDDPFVNVVQLGIGRAILVRDLLSLIRCLQVDDEKKRERRYWICQLARETLPQVIKEGRIRIGLEISKSLLEVLDFPTTVDHLTYTHLLLEIGKAEQAADILEIYRGDDLFAESGLNELERVVFALDWAKASKDTGRASQMHSEIIRVYEQMLTLLHELMSESEETGPLRRLEADILNNRATQIAVFGSESEWPQAQGDLEAAAEAYRLLGDYQNLLACRANFIAHSLDRFDRLGTKAPEASLEALSESLKTLDDIADKGNTSEELFFFFYQKGRILKRLYPDHPQRAIPLYESAYRVAQECGLVHRFPIAQRWVLWLRWRSHSISENDYLQGLRECVNLLNQHTEDAWAANSLCDTLLEIAQVLHNRGEMERAWQTAVEAFEAQARQFMRSRSNRARNRFQDILRLMDELKVDDKLRTSFVQGNTQSLRSLLGSSTRQSLQWKDIRGWLRQEEKC